MTTLNTSWAYRHLLENDFKRNNRITIYEEIELVKSLGIDEIGKFMLKNDEMFSSTDSQPLLMAAQDMWIKAFSAAKTPQENAELIGTMGRWMEYHSCFDNISGNLVMATSMPKKKQVTFIRAFFKYFHQQNRNGEWLHQEVFDYIEARLPDNSQHITEAVECFRDVFTPYEYDIATASELLGDVPGDTAAAKKRKFALVTVNEIFKPGFILELWAKDSKKEWKKTLMRDALEQVFEWRLHEGVDHYRQDMDKYVAFVSQQAKSTPMLSDFCLSRDGDDKKLRRI